MSSGRSARAELADLLQQAYLPNVVTIRQLTERGFDNEVYVAQLSGGRQVVLRSWQEPREREEPRARFLLTHGVPTPQLLAATPTCALYDFAPGSLLGDLIETGRATPESWRMVGRAFRRVHAIRFPAGLAGDVQPHQIILSPVDPVEQMHAWITESIPGLRRLAPAVLPYLPALHEIVDRSSVPLRMASTALLHGDDNMWNIIVGENEVSLIDWDGPKIGDPAMEVALLEKHASLFNQRGLDRAFFDGYGHPATEPNTSLHRIVQTMQWAAGDDWSSFEQQDLASDLHARTRNWLQTLLAYVAQLPAHIERLHTLV